MRCKEFLEGYTDFVDETGDEDFMARARGHLDGCAGCRRYDTTFRRGRSILADTLEEPELDADFHARLRHRLYSVDDRRAAARYGSSSRTVGASLFGIAAVAALGFLSPALVAEPEVALAPIEAERPRDRRSLGLRLPAATVLPIRLGRSQLELSGDDLWSQPANLFYEYAPVRGPYRARATRAVLE